MKNFTKYTHYLSFYTSTALAISELLPFLDTKTNGILHTIKVISDNYNNNFKN
jgi:hypothetical protein